MLTEKVWNCERRRRMPAGRPSAPSSSKKLAWPVSSAGIGLRSRYQTERGLNGESMSNTMRRCTFGSMRTRWRKRCEVCDLSPVLSTRVPFSVCAWNWSLMKNRLKRGSVETVCALLHNRASAAPSGRLKSSNDVSDARKPFTRVASPPLKATVAAWLLMRPSALRRSTRTWYARALSSGWICTRRFAVTSHFAPGGSDSALPIGSTGALKCSGFTQVPPASLPAMPRRFSGSVATSGHHTTRKPASSSGEPLMFQNWPHGVSAL